MNQPVDGSRDSRKGTFVLVCLSLLCLSLLSGCATLLPSEKINSAYEQLEPKLKAVGLEPIKDKDPEVAGSLNFIMGFGNAYLNQWGYFFGNWITWPFSIAWAVDQAKKDADLMNKQDTLDYYIYGIGQYNVKAHYPELNARLIYVPEYNVTENNVPGYNGAGYIIPEHKMKSPGLAAGLAILSPAGHIYAGEPGRGFAFMVGTLASLFVGVAVVGSVNPGSGYEGLAMAQAFAMPMFIWSIVDAYSIVKKNNAKVKEKYSLSFKPTDKGIKLDYSVKY